jgi:hypothetical protein
MRNWLVNQLVDLIYLVWPDITSIQMTRAGKGQHIWGTIHPLPEKMRGMEVGWDDFIVMAKEKENE